MTKHFRKHYTEKQAKKLLDEQCIFVGVEMRKWWNPVALFKGRFYFIIL